jgi:lysophospholipase L1-like esterase
VDGLPVAVPAAETAFQHVDHPHVDRDIALTFGASTLLGVQLGSPHGVRVHNLPMRGASGTLFDDVPASDWQHLRAHHVPGLVLLQFGGNAVPSLTTQASAQRYARNVARNIRHIQGMLPGVPIVFIGPSDMGRHPGEFPGLAHVVHALKDAVVANDALYWDLQAVMGGQGSMAAWMAEGLAGPDGVHFSPRGAKLVGQRLDVALRHEFKARFGTALHAVPAIRSPQEAGTP